SSQADARGAGDKLLCRGVSNSRYVGNYHQSQLLGCQSDSMQLAHTPSNSSASSWPPRSSQYYDIASSNRTQTTPRSVGGNKSFLISNTSKSSTERKNQPKAMPGNTNDSRFEDLASLDSGINEFPGDRPSNTLKK